MRVKRRADFNITDSEPTSWEDYAKWIFKERELAAVYLILTDSFMVVFSIKIGIFKLLVVFSIEIDILKLYQKSKFSLVFFSRHRKYLARGQPNATKV